jgi:hypothetical protein
VLDLNAAAAALDERRTPGKMAAGYSTALRVTPARVRVF